MPGKTVAQKARLKPGTSIAVLNPAPGVVESLGLPPETTFVEPAAGPANLPLRRYQGRA